MTDAVIVCSFIMTGLIGYLILCGPIRFPKRTGPGRKHPGEERRGICRVK